MVRSALVCLYLAVAVPAAAQAPPQPVIVTEGEATVKRAPDLAWVSIAAESRAATSAEAQRVGAAAMSSVQAALAKLGLPADAVKTTSYSLQQDLEWVSGRSHLKGYIVNNQIAVRVDSLDKLGAVLDASGGSGATSVAGLRFDVKDREALEREALRLAVENAMGRARAIAGGAATSLGPIVRIEEHGNMDKQPMMELRTMTAVAQPQTPISPGEIEIQAHVTLTVAIR